MPTPNDDRYGPDPAEWRPEYDEWVDKFLRPSVAGTPVVTTSTPALPEPSWIKQLATDAPPIRQEFGTYDPAEYQPSGHVWAPSEADECIRVYSRYAARHMVYGGRRRGRLRSFLARLADSVRGRK